MFEFALSLPLFHIDDIDCMLDLYSVLSKVEGLFFQCRCVRINCTSVKFLIIYITVRNVFCMVAELLHVKHLATPNCH